MQPDSLRRIGDALVRSLLRGLRLFEIGARFRAFGRRAVAVRRFESVFRSIDSFLSLDRLPVRSLELLARGLFLRSRIARVLSRRFGGAIRSVRLSVGRSCGCPKFLQFLVARLLFLQLGFPVVMGGLRLAAQRLQDALIVIIDLLRRSIRNGAALSARLRTLLRLAAGLRVAEDVDVEAQRLPVDLAVPEDEDAAILAVDVDEADLLTRRRPLRSTVI